jgi:hypothetical protein
VEVVAAYLLVATRQERVELEAVEMVGERLRGLEATHLKIQVAALAVVETHLATAALAAPVSSS